MNSSGMVANKGRRGTSCKKRAPPEKKTTKTKKKQKNINKNKKKRREQRDRELGADGASKPATRRWIRLQEASSADDLVFFEVEAR